MERIKALGGKISPVEGATLRQFLGAVKFDTVLYPKPLDLPWARAHEREPIIGIGEFVERHRDLYRSDKERFRATIIEHYFQLTEEGRGQVFFKNELFTPFKEGTGDYEEWNGEWEPEAFREVIVGDAMELMFIGYSYGFPDHLFVCLTDPNPDNPVVYGTDHEVYFDDISRQGTLREFFDSFLTPVELIELIERGLDSRS